MQANIFAKEILFLERKQFIPPQFKRYQKPSFKQKIAAPRKEKNGPVQTPCFFCLSRKVVTPFICAECRGTVVSVA